MMARCFLSVFILQSRTSNSIRNSKDRTLKNQKFSAALNLMAQKVINLFTAGNIASWW